MIVSCKGIAGLVRRAVRIGLERQQLAVRVRNFVLVESTITDAGQEDFPNAVSGVQAHDVAAAVPAVEVADHTDARRVGCPHREACTVDAVVAGQVRAEFPVDSELLPDARALLKLAAVAARQNLAVEAGDIGINYLRNRVAEKARA